MDSDASEFESANVIAWHLKFRIGSSRQIFATAPLIYQLTNEINTGNFAETAWSQSRPGGRKFSLLVAEWPDERTAVTRRHNEKKGVIAMQPHLI